jgi:hypothetical protein
MNNSFRKLWETLDGMVRIIQHYNPKLDRKQALKRAVKELLKDEV